MSSGLDRVSNETAVPGSRGTWLRLAAALAALASGAVAVVVCILLVRDALG
jgi:hypothetical protein